MQFHAISRNFHAIWAISAIIGPISTCWVSKCIFSCWEIQWCCFHALSCTPSRNFMQFWQFQPFLDRFLHVGYQNACTLAEKFNGNIFTHFHTLLHALSRNCHSISPDFSHFWAKFNMLGILKHVLELWNSLVVLIEAVGLLKGPKAPKKRPKASKGDRRPPSSPLKS